MDRRKKIVLLLAALGVVILLRESGHLTVNSYVAHYEGEHEANINSEGMWQVGELVRLNSKDETKTDNHADDDSGSGVGFTTTVAEPESTAGVSLAVKKRETYLTRALEESLRGEVPADGSRQILIENFELSGPYWMPFSKTGRFTYVVFVKEEGTGYKNTCGLSGELKFDMKGLCPVRELEKQLARKIAKKIGTLCQFKNSRP